MLRLGRAPAKLNLGLELTGRRGDGYHELKAVSQTIDWSDVVALEIGSDSELPLPHLPDLQVWGPQAHQVPLGQSNSAVRAALLLRERGLGWPILRIGLEKRIPPQSGLGGGSADAAAVLRLAGTGADLSLLKTLALECGADVPFGLSGGACVLGGIGEQLWPVPAVAAGAFLVVMLGSVSTAAAYAATVAADFSDGSRIETLAAALRTGSPPDSSLFGSGLQAAALRAYPQLWGRWQELRRATAGASWSMTGSGGAFFSYQPDALAAATLARAVASALPDLSLRVALPLAAAPGPVAAPELHRPA